MPWSDEAKAKASQRAKAQFAKRKRNAQGRLLPLGSTADRAPIKGTVQAFGDAVGYTGSLGGDTTRARRALNLATLEGMLSAYRRGGQAAIDKVMRQSPAIFLKMLVLLVPREMQIEHSGSIKAMTTEQIEDAIAAIQRLMDAKMVDVTPKAEKPSAT